MAKNRYLLTQISPLYWGFIVKILERENVDYYTSLLPRQSMVLDLSVADQRQIEIEASANKTTIVENLVLLGK